MSQQLFSLAFGVGTQNRQNNWLEVFYAQPLLKPSAELLAAIAPILGYSGGNQAISFSTSQAEKLAEVGKKPDTGKNKADKKAGDKAGSKAKGNNGSTRYVVRKGDTIYSIARQFNVDKDELLRWNKLSSNAIKPGKTLTIQ